MAQWVRTRHGLQEVLSSIPSLAQWVKDLVLLWHRACSWADSTPSLGASTCGRKEGKEGGREGGRWQLWLIVKSEWKYTKFQCIVINLPNTDTLVSHHPVDKQTNRPPKSPHSSDHYSLKENHYLGLYFHQSLPVLKAVEWDYITFTTGFFCLILCLWGSSLLHSHYCIAGVFNLG